MAFSIDVWPPGRWAAVALPGLRIPARLLHGILPDALLDDYTFWLDEKDARLDEPSVLRGYKQPHAVARESGAPLDAIVIHCTPQGKGDPSGLGRSDAVGCVQRVLAVREGEGDFKFNFFNALCIFIRGR